MQEELRQLYTILAAFLGEAKGGFDPSNLQLQFPCPRCIEKNGPKEAMKYNLECNLARGVYHCWSCSAEGDRMSGSIFKLIRDYGNDELLKEYQGILDTIKNSDLYKFHTASTLTQIEQPSLVLPNGFTRANRLSDFPKNAREYLEGRGITDRIINEYDMGFTRYSKESAMTGNRVFVPSFDGSGKLNYWSGRDFTGNKKRQKYCNPKVERRDVIFNENKIDWDADVTLVEGVFDHIVVPNSIPMLGKVINPSFKLYWALFGKCHARVNIMLDGDARENAIELYRLLNHDDLYGRIRLVPLEKEEDPSSVFEEEGFRGIARRLSCAEKVSEITLLS
jgi:DNA primase